MHMLPAGVIENQRRNADIVACYTLYTTTSILIAKGRISVRQIHAEARACTSNCNIVNHCGTFSRV